MFSLSNPLSKGSRRADKFVHILAILNSVGVVARYDTMLVIAFHPELMNDTHVFQYVLEMTGYSYKDCIY